ncbi:MAG: hypothetical protein KJ963_09615 [Bacteroidetes bacterium]|nr:hypothetical protein [Bacteroidota bacterium]MBU1423212.1 hypothetical protein [Bacteroidota bacterium]MBU2637320.1 hypothetical protein [Bacteroidota bacterium]
MTAKDTKFQKHPLTIAWEKFLESDEGKRCLEPFKGMNPKDIYYLTNRLHRAFVAGVLAKNMQ